MENLISVVDLRKSFALSEGLLSFLKRERDLRRVRAVDGVSFNVGQAEVFGLVGESGCGKTTVGKSVLRLLEPDGGRVYYEGTDILQLKRRAMRSRRKELQIVFQDPYESLDPRLRVLNCIAEPLQVHQLVRTRAALEHSVLSALEKSGLRPPHKYLQKYPHHLSGGERQRLVIATALVLEPRFIVADEPTSMLDVSIQAGLLELLTNLKHSLGIGFLFITHDLSVAASFADRLGVMYLGKIVETGSAENVLASPLHPYTQALVSVVPTTQILEKKERIVLEGETPSAVSIPSGCRFHPRCRERLERCSAQTPSFREVERGHWVACLLYTEELQEDGSEGMP